MAGIFDDAAKLAVRSALRGIGPSKQGALVGPPRARQHCARSGAICATQVPIAPVESVIVSEFCMTRESEIFVAMAAHVCISGEGRGLIAAWARGMDTSGF